MNILLGCARLKTTWNNMVADKTFPVADGTVVAVSCEEGYQLIGDSEVTCSLETDSLFDYSDEPRCGNYLDLKLKMFM